MELNIDDKEIERVKLQGDLLHAVKECQKHYGGRVELATELDKRVCEICRCFEEIFNHGLRTSTLDKNSSALKQATQKLKETTKVGRLTFWHCVRNLLSRHEQDRYNTLHNVKSNSGRGRAWLRASLNERCLERYLLSLLSDEQLISDYYESWAYFSDQEKSSILPSTAAGLVPILFAISIDRSELNREDNGKDSNEPVIVTSSDIPKAKNYDKRKIQTNIVTFDDSSDECNMNDDIVESASSQVEMEIASEASEVLCSREYVLTSNHEQGTGLRPMSDEAIGELIPVIPNNDICIDESTVFAESQSEDTVSVESLLQDDNFEKMYEMSKDHVKSYQTDNEDLKTKIEELKRENEVLRHQLRKYVTAVQMLKEEDHDCNNSSLNLYEQKLVQVAEMHGELMELNARIIKESLMKDTQIQILQKELILLRGPLPANNLLLQTLVTVAIPSVFSTGNSPNPHHVYQLHFRIGTEEWNVYRRYAQLHTYHRQVKKDFPAFKNYHFPPKKTIGNKEALFVEERRQKLQMYLRQLINFLLTQDEQLSTHPSKSLFIARIPFFSEQYKLENNTISSRFFTSCLTNEDVVDEPIDYYTGL